MKKTKIEWTNTTWNPTIGCNKVSRGCKNCYAEIMHRRLMGMYPEKYKQPFLDGAFEYPEALTIPLKWKKPAMVFVDSMSDLFHENISFEYIDKVFSVMAANQHLTFQILTKRPERMLEYFDFRAPLYGDYPNAETNMRVWDICLTNYSRFTTDWPLKNVWIGTSVEDQKAADERIPFLLKVPAAVRFLSCEPLISSVDLNINIDVLKWSGYNKLNVLTGVLTNNSRNSTCATPLMTTINWVIVGGESGNNAAPMHPDWVRTIRNQCEAAGVPFFFKQWGTWLPTTMPLVSSQIAILPQYFASSKSKFYQSADGRSEYYKGGKNRTGNKIDGLQHLEFPKQ